TGTDPPVAALAALRALRDPSRRRPLLRRAASRARAADAVGPHDLLRRRARSGRADRRAARHRPVEAGRTGLSRLRFSGWHRRPHRRRSRAMAWTLMLVLGHGGHGDLGAWHGLWHATPWLLAFALAAWVVARGRRAARRRPR